MTPHWRKLLWILLLGAAFAVLAAACNSSASGTTGGNVKAQGQVDITPLSNQKPTVGRPAPNFTLPDVDGNLVSLHDYQGQVVLVNFWGTWCPPCRAEMPDIQKIYDEFKPRGLEIIGVDAPPDTEEDVRKFVERLDLTWVFVMDKKWEVARTYAIGAFPSTFFLDKDHILRQVRIGAMNEKELRERLSRLFE